MVKVNDKVVFNNSKVITAKADGLLKAAALLYLEDALYNEEYEWCAELVKKAESLGAMQSEISGVIAAHIKKAGKFFPNEVRLKKIRPARYYGGS